MVEVPIQAVVSGVMLGGAIALIAVGISLIWGIMEIINFAYAEYVMLSMYLAYIVNFQLRLDPLLILPISVPVAFFMGVATYKIAIRRVVTAPIFAQILCTFGIFLFIRYVAFAVFLPDARILQYPYFKGVIESSGIVMGAGDLVVFLTCVAATATMFWFIEYTKTGKALRATAQNRSAALSVGIDIEKMFTIAWGLSLAAAGVAGTLLTYIIYSHPLIGDNFILPAFAAVALGGFGNIYGAFFGGLIIGVVQVVGGSMLGPGLKFAYVYIIFLAILFFRPRGLFTK